jgi:ClpP class serine protease
MAYSKFFQEILADNLAVDYQGIQSHLPFIKGHLTGAIIELPDREKLVAKVYDRNLSFFDFMGEKPNQDPGQTSEGVLVLPVRGLLTKYGDWWDYGTEELAEILTEAYADASIRAIVLQFHSGGGTTHSVIPLEAAIRKRNKPVISAVDTKTFSASLYLAVFGDKLIAVDPMAEIGSIGLMTRILDNSKMLENEGIKIIEIYPPESNWKNKTVLEALKGNTQLIIQEELTPWATYFQDVVRANRPKLDESVEGILNGRTFYAADALSNGLIDAIMPMDEIVQYAFDYTQKEVNQFFNT